MHHALTSASAIWLGALNLLLILLSCSLFCLAPQQAYARQDNEIIQHEHKQLHFKLSPNPNPNPNQNQNQNQNPNQKHFLHENQHRDHQHQHHQHQHHQHHDHLEHQLNHHNSDIHHQHQHHNQIIIQNQDQLDKPRPLPMVDKLPPVIQRLIKKHIKQSGRFLSLGQEPQLEVDLHEQELQVQPETQLHPTHQQHQQRHIMQRRHRQLYQSHESLSHLARIKAGYEEPITSNANNGLNSFFVAALFGLGVTVSLLAIAKHKMRSFKRRQYLKQHHPNYHHHHHHHRTASLTHLPSLADATLIN